MSKALSRRRLLAGTAALGGAAALPTAEAHAGTQTKTCPPDFPGATVTSSDQRYGDLVRSWNGRFVGAPDSIRLVGSASDVEKALAEAVRRGKRLAVRSGGHCLEGFVTDPSVEVQIDMSAMSSIYFDSQRNAIAIEPGASLRQVYKTLFTRWAVTLPGGICPAVGVGGHFQGGGYGPLSRRSGVVPDHLYAVEVVTVDKSGTPKTIVATRKADDPNRDLWWAHTGGGGGNFGVVTKYWMRSANTTGSNPAKLLPKPPKAGRVITLAWPWSKLDQQSFTRLVKNYATWHESNSAPGSAAARLYSDLSCLHAKSSPAVALRIVVDPTDSDADSLVAGLRSAMNEGMSFAPSPAEKSYGWLESTNAIGSGDTGSIVGIRSKQKGSYLRKSYTDAQLATTYRYLTATDIVSTLAGVILGGYGGQVSAVAPDATAVAQRDSVLKLLHVVYWSDPAQDEKYLSWIREFYRDVHAASGGVPELDGVSDGSYINYADVDFADPQWNTSGVPWSRLYYKDNYPRLQQVKAAYDPRNVFHHALSIELPS